MRELFLDANAHLPMSQPALDAFVKTSGSLAGHGHALAPSAPGRAAEAAIEDARGTIAERLGAEHPNQIIFTSTCTEACSWGLELFAKINKDKHILITPTEHPAVRQKAKELFPDRIMLGANKDGLIDLEYPIDKRSAVISIYVQNEIGIIQPVQQLNTSSLFLDMSQGPGKVNLPKLKDIKNLDVAVFGAHKFGGPSSVGFIYLRDVNAWEKFGTGPRYYLDRVGTPDVCSIVATAAALEHAIDTLPQRTDNIVKFRSVTEPALEELGFEIIGKDSPRVPNTTFSRIPQSNLAQILMQKLSNKGIYIGLGSACGSIHSGTTPLMKILSRVGTIKDFIRISQYGEYGEEDAKYFIEKLSKVL